MAPPRLCSCCQTARAVLKRPKNHDQLCKECFFSIFEEEVHHTITSHRLFRRGERVALAASGGKDSTVLAHVVTTLNKRYDYGLDLFLLSIDEGISGYRDDSLETVKRNEQTYGIPLVVISYKQLYDWTMDEIVAQIGTKNNCTFCGVFRRQALDRGAVIAKADKIATGHNADDVAETVLLNILRGDVPRLGRCASATTGEDGSGLPRVKPFKYTYEKEIVMYAYFKRLDYFSTECIYAPFAARGFARDFVKDVEAARPSAILDIIRSAEHYAVALGQQTSTTLGQHAAQMAAVMAKVRAANNGQAQPLLPSSSAPANATEQPSASVTSDPQQVAHSNSDVEPTHMNGEASELADSQNTNGGLKLPSVSTLVSASYRDAEHAGGAPILRAASGAPTVAPQGAGKGAVAAHAGSQQVPKQCQRCGYLTSQPICKACVLLEGLNRGRAGMTKPVATPVAAEHDKASSPAVQGPGMGLEGSGGAYPLEKMEVPAIDNTAGITHTAKQRTARPVVIEYDSHS